MNKKIICSVKHSIILIVCAFVIGVVVTHYSQADIPPEKKALAFIENEYVIEYLVRGDVPVDTDFLSRKAKALLAIYKISHDEEANILVVRYSYATWPSSRQRLMNALSLGLGFKPLEVGARITPESIRHNAPILRASGGLVGCDLGAD